MKKVFKFEVIKSWYSTEEIMTVLEVNETEYNMVLELQQLEKDKESFQNNHPIMGAFFMGVNENGKKLRKGIKYDKMEIEYKALCTKCNELFNYRIVEIYREFGISDCFRYNFSLELNAREVLALKDTVRD